MPALGHAPCFRFVSSALACKLNLSIANDGLLYALLASIYCSPLMWTLSFLTQTQSSSFLLQGQKAAKHMRS